jgi:hypothetical protein
MFGFSKKNNIAPYEFGFTVVPTQSTSLLPMASDPLLCVLRSAVQRAAGEPSLKGKAFPPQLNDPIFSYSRIARYKPPPPNSPTAQDEA